MTNLQDTGTARAEGAAGEAPAPGTATAPAPDIEYITADLWSPQHKDRPCGVRGWLVIGIGRKWVHLFAPASLAAVKIAIDEFDALPRVQSVAFDPAAMARRIDDLRANRRKYGMHDGGRAADKALSLLRAQLKNGQPQ